MNHPALPSPTTRREFLKTTGRGLGLIAFSRFAPEFLVQTTLARAPAAEKDRSILVLVQLAGGNDGLNTLVPFEDAHYHRLRPTLALKRDSLLRLDDTLGLHPSCGALHGLFNDGKLGVVQAVGYPNPNRSHFRSMEIWESASDSSDFVGTGWLGRFLDNTCGGAPGRPGPLGVHTTVELPQSLYGEHPHPTFGLAGAGRARQGLRHAQALEFVVEAGRRDDHDHGPAGFLRQTMMDALVTEKTVQRTLTDYKPSAAYPGTPFAQSLKATAALIAAGQPTRVYFVSLPGFDTHSGQAAPHAALLRTLSEGLAAFQNDLEAHRLDNQVLTMTFSEFGRRPGENESLGTDHGTAAPLFVMGSRVKGGILGAAPSLDLPQNEDLAYTTDFRQVYATVLERWFDCRAESVLGQTYAPVEFV